METNAHSIHIFLLNGEPEGIRSAHIPLRSIMGIAFKDVQLAHARQSFESELGRSGVYVLMGEEADGKAAAYIGESEKIWDRLQTHHTKATDEASIEWTEAFVFVSQDETLTKGHVRFAEAELIAAAKANPHWTVKNDQAPTSDGKLPKPDEYFMREFVEQVKILAGTLGCAVFKSVSGKPKQATLFDASAGAAEATSADTENPHFKMSGNGYSAEMVVYLDTGELSVRQGSIARETMSNAAPSSAKTLREKLLSDGVLTKTTNGLLFNVDYAFSSASAAASLISGNAIAGTIAWKRSGEAGQPSSTFGEWKSQQLNSEDITGIAKNTATA